MSLGRCAEHARPGRPLARLHMAATCCHMQPTAAVLACMAVAHLWCALPAALQPHALWGCGVSMEVVRSGR